MVVGVGMGMKGYKVRDAKGIGDDIISQHCLIVWLFLFCFQ